MTLKISLCLSVCKAQTHLKVDRFRKCIWVVENMEPSLFAQSSFTRMIKKKNLQKKAKQVFTTAFSSDVNLYVSRRGKQVVKEKMFIVLSPFDQCPLVCPSMCLPPSWFRDVDNGCVMLTPRCPCILAVSGRGHALSSILLYICPSHGNIW